VIGTVASLGALAAPTAALTASYVTAVTTATLSVVSLAADVASIALLATGNENAGRILGWVGMATGLASAAPSMAGAAAKGVKSAGKFVGSWQHKLQHAGGVPGGNRAFQGGASASPRLGQEARHALTADDLRYVRQHFDMPQELTGVRLNEMPDLVMHNIIGRLPGSDLVSLSQTSSTMRASVQRNTHAIQGQLPTLHSAPQEANRAYVNYVQETWLGRTNGVLPEQIPEAGISPFATTHISHISNNGYAAVPDIQSSIQYKNLLRVRNAQAQQREWEAALRSIRLE